MNSVVTSIRTAISKALARPEPTTPVGAAFQNHLREIESKRRARLALAAKVAATRADVDAASAASDKVERLRAEIDLALADARYAGMGEPDLTERHRELYDAEKLAEWYAVRARAAETARGRYLADIEGLNTQLVTLDAITPTLLHAVLADDELAAYAPEWHAALDAFLAVNRKVYAVVVAADKLAVTHSIGEFRGAGLWHEVFTPAPNHPAFQRGATDPWEAPQARTRDAHALDREAEELVRRMLTSEASA